MSSKKKWLLVFVAILGLVIGYGEVANAWSFGPAYYTGYFNQQVDGSRSGSTVWPTSGGPGPGTCNFLGCVNTTFTGSEVGTRGCAGDGTFAIPSWVDTAADFNDFVLCKLWYSGNQQERTGALFIIGTLIGSHDPAVVNDFYAGWGEMSTRVNYAASQGWIDWNYNPGFGSCPASLLPNTYYNPGLNDEFAFTSNCGNPEMHMIRFNWPTGSYHLKRYCANPMGAEYSLPPKPADFNLNPSVTAQITSSGVPIAGNVAQVGDTITFTYTVLNSGAADSPTATCTYKQATYAGYNTNPPGGAFTPGGANCAPSRTFPAGANTTIASETVNGLADNTSVCRSLTVQPASLGNAGSITSPTSCVFVAGKPFARVFGGDVAAGGVVIASSGTCASNNGAAVIGWNRGGAPNNYEGAGVQYAAYALSTILSVATSVGNGAGAAAPPTGLSFANTSANLPAGQYGGSLGSVPCIPDYYGTLPAAYTTIAGASVSAAQPNGVNYKNGDLQLTAGTINAGNRVSVYVHGNVYISGNITYGGSGSWTSANVPLFRLVVSGNIYIDAGVSQLDGQYIAQSPDGVTNGIIYTCATGLAAPVALTSLATSCGTQLTVNGSFVARQVYLMRAAGSLNTNTPAEVFNYNPALWMSQPTGLVTGAASYDSITSLPPVL